MHIGSRSPHFLSGVPYTPSALAFLIHRVLRKAFAYWAEGGLRPKMLQGILAIISSEVVAMGEDQSWP
eukprot:scaffold13199_cov63-Cyclotella_meneghiniana.AAC.11